jgi:diguanylate cyclase (GGDEF)-like protein
MNTTGFGSRSWLYALAVLPLLTDLLETGAWPDTARSWLTEIIVGIAITILVHRLLKAHYRLIELAGTDSLTGLLNRRRFFESLNDESVRAQRLHCPLSLIWIDLDDFKAVNDGRGHASGDRMLQLFAVVLQSVIRDRVDHAFRVGGDEFAILLPGAAGEKAEHVLSRIRQACARISGEPPVRFSAGLIQYSGTESADGFLKRADEAMSRVKRCKNEMAEVASSRDAA